MKSSAACVGALILAPLALARPEPNAFLNKAEPNIQGIIHQMESDPAVYARYAAHFGMSRSEMASYFATLKPSRVEKAGPYVVYNVHEDGIVRSRIFNLKVGSLIYIDSVGRPILKKLCGNPMAPSPKKLSAVSLVNELPLAPPIAMKPMEESPVPETPVAMTVLEELDTPPVETTPELTTPPITPPVDVPVKPEVKPSFEIGAPPSLGILGPLLAGGLIFGGQGGGGGHEGAVPEPATMAATFTLIGLYAANRRKGQRKA